MENKIELTYEELIAIRNLIGAHSLRSLEALFRRHQDDEDVKKLSLILNGIYRRCYHLKDEDIVDSVIRTDKQLLDCLGVESCQECGQKGYLWEKEVKEQYERKKTLGEKIRQTIENRCHSDGSCSEFDEIWEQYMGYTDKSIEELDKEYGI